MPSPTMILRKGLWVVSPTPSGLADAGIGLNANFVVIGDALEIVQSLNTAATDPNISGDGSGTLTVVSIYGDGTGLENVVHPQDSVWLYDGNGQFYVASGYDISDLNNDAGYLVAGDSLSGDGSGITNLDVNTVATDWNLSSSDGVITVVGFVSTDSQMSYNADTVTLTAPFFVGTFQGVADDAQHAWNADHADNANTAYYSTYAGGANTDFFMNGNTLHTGGGINLEGASVYGGSFSGDGSAVVNLEWGHLADTPPGVSIFSNDAGYLVDEGFPNTWTVDSSYITGLDFTTVGFAGHADAAYYLDGAVWTNSDGSIYGGRMHFDGDYVNTDGSGYLSAITMFAEAFYGDSTTMDGIPQYVQQALDLKAPLWVPMMLTVPTDTSDRALNLQMQFSDDPAFGTINKIIDTANDSATGEQDMTHNGRSHINAFDGSIFIPFPEGGFGTPFYGTRILLDVSQYDAVVADVASGLTYYRYRWTVTSGDPTDWTGGVVGGQSC